MFQKVRKKPLLEQIHSKNPTQKSSFRMEQPKSTLYPKKTDETGNKTNNQLQENIDNLKRINIAEIEEDCPEKSNQSLPRIMQDFAYFLRKNKQRKKEGPRKKSKYEWKALSNIKVNKSLF